MCLDKLLPPHSIHATYLDSNFKELTLGSLSYPAQAQIAPNEQALSWLLMQSVATEYITILPQAPLGPDSWLMDSAQSRARRFQKPRATLCNSETSDVKGIAYQPNSWDIRSSSSASCTLCLCQCAGQ